MSEIPDFLLALLRCPVCRSPIQRRDPAALQCVNPACRLGYPIRDGIPIMLEEEALRPPLERPSPSPRPPS